MPGTEAVTHSSQTISHSAVDVCNESEIAGTQYRDRAITFDGSTPGNEWEGRGFAVKGSLAVAGSASGTAIYDCDGYGTNSSVPLKGTLLLSVPSFSCYS